MCAQMMKAMKWWRVGHQRSPAPGADRKCTLSAWASAMLCSSMRAGMLGCLLPAAGLAEVLEWGQAAISMRAKMSSGTRLVGQR